MPKLVKQSGLPPMGSDIVEHLPAVGQRSPAKYWVVWQNARRNFRTADWGLQWHAHFKPLVTARRFVPASSRFVPSERAIRGIARSAWPTRHGPRGFLMRSSLDFKGLAPRHPDVSRSEQWHRLRAILHQSPATNLREVEAALGHPEWMRGRCSPPLPGSCDLFEHRAKLRGLGRGMASPRAPLDLPAHARPRLWMIVGPDFVGVGLELTRLAVRRSLTSTGATGFATAHPALCTRPKPKLASMRAFMQRCRMRISHKIALTKRVSTSWSFRWPAA